MYSGWFAYKSSCIILLYINEYNRESYSENWSYKNVKIQRIGDIYPHVIGIFLCSEYHKVFLPLTIFYINNSVNCLKKSISFSKRFYFDGLWLFQREFPEFHRYSKYRHMLNVICFREVWPENDCFGSHNMSPEEEFLALRDIFYADLGGECSFSV